MRNWSTYQDTEVEVEIKNKEKKSKLQKKINIYIKIGETSICQDKKVDIKLKKYIKLKKIWKLRLKFEKLQQSPRHGSRSCKKKKNWGKVDSFDENVEKL